MKLKYNFKYTFLLVIVAIFLAGCAKQEDLIEELPTSRAFAPVGLEAKIRNQINVELKWTVRDDVSQYVVEFAENDSTFSSVFKSIEVAPEEVPVLEQLEQEKRYFIRVKALSSEGKGESTWAVTSAMTQTEQLFLPILDGDITDTEATLRWFPNSEVTQLEFNGGAVVHDITEQEKEDGIATVTGLLPETNYSVALLNNGTVRGNTSFTTGVDLSGGILVTPADDLLQMIADALPGDLLLLEPGDYTAQAGAISIDKSLTIRGLVSFDKPIVSLSISLINGATDFALIDVEFTGNGPGGYNNFVRFEEAGDYNSLLVRGCIVSDYVRSFISGNADGAIVQTVLVEDCIVTNFLTDGGDFIDFRNSNVLNISVTTSTFNNCAGGRDFFRIDAEGTLNATGEVSNVLLEDCTLYQCSNNASRRILYIRFNDNDIEVRNNLITDTMVEGYSDREQTDMDIVFVNNNYFNAPTLFDSNVLRYDDSSSFDTFDPGFADPTNGDFTITNQDVIDKQVGDPRWY